MIRKNQIATKAQSHKGAQKKLYYDKQFATTWLRDIDSMLLLQAVRHYVADILV